MCLILPKASMAFRSLQRCFKGNRNARVWQTLIFFSILIWILVYLRGVWFFYKGSVIVATINEKELTANTTGYCPVDSPLLVGWADVFLVASGARQENENSFNSRMADKGVKHGGKYEPINCRSRNKVAIVVPYRNRDFHLKIFLRYIHPFLQRQQLNYIIVIVEQTGGSPFNRGMLMNIGFKETLLHESVDCFIFHDVDLLPEDDRNLYTCPEVGQPRQMAFAIDIYDYKPTPHSHFGGVNSFSVFDFQRVNGFSNCFWGWGSEDDDLYRRVLHHNLTVTRVFDGNNFQSRITRYRMIDHPKAKSNPDRDSLYGEGSGRIYIDGINNLKYKKLRTELKPLFTHILVNIKQTD